LATVLSQIARRAGFTAVLSGDLSAPVTLSFTKIELSKGLRQLLGRLPFVLIYGPSPGDGGPPPLLEMRVYGESGGETASVAAPRHDLRALLPWIAAATADEAALRADIAGLARDDRVQAMRWFAEQRDGQAVGRLRYFLALDADASVRRQAALALSDVGGDTAVAALDVGLGDEDPEVRFAVVDALGRTRGAGAELCLGQVLFGERDPEIRLTAVVGLGELRGAAARAFLEAAAKDPDEKVRAAADFFLVDWD
jgi:hypothetical protein